ncbi:MAG: chromate transporter [Ruminococcaceae bacterium]|nr:chromate transporter [Oscillospiraceae bacterium]
MKQGRFKLCLQLFCSFFKIGLFTFGGGMAMIPFIQRETVEKHGWIEEKDILEILAISESTPGPIAINTATFIGYQKAGVFGSAAATFGVVLPSFFIISIISLFLKQFMGIKAVEYAFAGIRAGVIALVIKALIKLFKGCPKNVVSYVIIALAFIAAVVFDVNVIIIIISAGLIGLASLLIANNRKKEVTKK